MAIYILNNKDQLMMQTDFATTSMILDIIIYQDYFAIITLDNKISFLK